MTYEIVWVDEAFAAAAVLMADDPVGLAAVFNRVDDLASNPHPPQAVQWGHTGFLRLRIGRYRVLYEIDEEVIRIDVIRESIRQVVGGVRPRPHGGLFASGQPVARQDEEMLSGFGQR